MDFVNDLEVNEELTSSIWTCTVAAGADDTPHKRLEGPSITLIPMGGEKKTATVQRIGGLLPDVTYVLKAEVITTFGNTRSLWSHVRGVNTD